MLTSYKFEVTQSDLANIVVRASSLSERLNKGWFEVNTAPVNEQQGSEESLNRWCQIVAQGNWQKFQKRLLWDGVDVDTVRAVISSPPIPNNQNLPSWSTTLKEIIQMSSVWGMSRSQNSNVKHKPDELLINNQEFLISIDSENPLPFEDLLLPSVYVARQKLLTYLHSPTLSTSCLPLELLSKEAYLKLERSLLSSLANLCENTLEFEFACFRPLGYSFLNLLETQIKTQPQKTYYEAFVQNLLQDGLLGFFQKYPVLGRLITTRIDFWVEATAEFLQRLKADLHEIQELFQPQQESRGESPITPLGKVIEIEPNLSDSHNRGHSAIALTFESELKLIYKPKDLGLDVAYNQILDWCNQQGVSLPFKILKVLNRQTYGWVEYVKQLPIEDATAARRFYQRTGMLLCLLYVLGVTDCHYENLIASGEHLVLVDMETLMHHEARLEDFPEQQQQMALNRSLFNPQYSNSVLRTGLLPRWDFNKDKSIAYDISALGSIDAQPSPWRVSQWKFVNTDNMHRASTTATIPPKKNVPILNGMPLSPSNYLEELVEGFEQMYCFLLEHRQVLLTDEFQIQVQPNNSIQNTKCKVYSVILQTSLTPEFLRNGVNRSIQLDILARAFLTTENKPNTWSILHSELSAMEQLDIPYFATYSDSDALTVGVEQPIQHFLTEPSYSQVISRLQKLDETDLVRQVAIIRGTFYAKVAQLQGTEQAGAEYEHSSIVPLQAIARVTENLLTSSQLFAAASTIAEEIHSHAIHEASGNVYWMGLSYVPEAERFQLQPLNETLYEGNCGIALFLSALDYVAKNNRCRDLALGAIHSLREVLKIADAQLMQKLTQKIGIGGATGLSAIIYSLVRISHFLDEPTLIIDALKAASLITPEAIATDQKLDVMTGAAGAILGLLVLYNETADPAVLDKAIACGQHLLEHRISVDGSPRAWKSVEDKPLTGFSHGATGIAYALLRLYAVTQDSAYKEAALEGIADERSVFSSSAANWPDFRSFAQQNTQPGFMTSWCHGAAGIGLGWLGALSILETKEIHQDLEVALQTIQNYGLQGVDHLCCGNFGRLEVLLLAAQKLARPELQELTLQKAAWVVARAKQTGAYQLFANFPKSVFSPSFFQGTAGIGYELLRLAYPEVLPSVLLWE
jgi:type 2 lantibiotic biosynthesis protein LanM